MTHNWFECKIRYEKVMENGMNKKVTEPYLVDALSFTEAEARIIEEMTPFISGELRYRTSSELTIQSCSSRMKKVRTSGLPASWSLSPLMKEQALKREPKPTYLYKPPTFVMRWLN